jgi:uncharacterized membrane protein YkvA (DUF1232 family)
VTEPAGWFARNVERISKKLGSEYLLHLALKGSVAHALGFVPKRMSLVANQTRLVLELIDDFKGGAYRAIPWHSIAVIAGAVLYTVSPADVVPDTLPMLGALDDLAVLALATRLVQKDLRAYCRFKGYDQADYF